MTRIINQEILGVCTYYDGLLEQQINLKERKIITRA